MAKMTSFELLRTINTKKESALRITVVTSDSLDNENY